MKKTYITPISRYCVISESDMMCTSGDEGLHLYNTEGNNATYDGTGGDDNTDTYVKAQNIWDMEW